MKRAVVHKAYPGLRGLVSDEVGRGPRFYPWPLVSPQPSHRSPYFVCFDGEGGQQSEGGRPLRIRVDGWRELALAGRAWERSLRHAWRRRDITVDQRFASDRRDLWVALLIGLGLLILAPGTAGWLVWVIWRDLAAIPLREDLIWVPACFGAGFLAIIMCMTAIFACMAREAVNRLRKPSVVAASANALNVRVQLDSGVEVTALWSDVQHIRGHHISFRNGLDLWLPIQPGSQRIIFLLQLVQEQFLPRAAARRRKSEERVWLRMGVFVLVLAGLTGLFVERLNDQDLTQANGPLAALLVMCFGAAWALYARLLPALVKHQARWRRRRGR